MEADPSTDRKLLEKSIDEGIKLFNSREFFEAHEIWEEQWQQEEGDERRLLQGLIQVAAGLYKLQVGMPSGTHKLLIKAVEHLKQVPREKHYNIDLLPLIESAEYWRDESRKMVENFATRYDSEKLPSLKCSSLSSE